MNLDVLKQKLIKKTIKRLSWHEEQNSNSDDLYLSTRIVFKDCPKGMEMYLNCDKDGTMVVFFNYGSFELTEANLKLVNHFNNNVSFIHAYITENRKKNLRIEYGIIECNDEDQMVEEILRSIDMLIDDHTIRYLEPLLIVSK